METPHASSQPPANDSVHSTNIIGHAPKPDGISHRPRYKVSRTASRITGCVSKVSTLETREHAYFDALKDYAVHYANAQAYLATEDMQIAHDYSLIANSLNEPDHGLLGYDGEPATFAHISDDEIDKCGYLGWLRH